MIYNLNYEEEINKKRIKNLEEIKNLIRNTEKYIDLPNWLKTKIKNEVKKYSNTFSEEDVFREIKESENIIRHYQKDPIKQGFHQNLAYMHLFKNLSDIVDIKPPELLKNTYLTSSGILTTEELRGNKAISKSIDFIIYGKYNVYAITHKYTKEAGGSQDNQYQDLVKFLQCSPKNPKYMGKDLIVAAIADGDYYRNKIDIIKQDFSNKWYLICTIDQFIEKVIELEK